MQKIPMNKIYVLFMFLCVICTNVRSQEKSEYIIAYERIDELVSIIGANLQGTTVYDLFIKEQKAWEDYRDAHLETMFPEYINGVKMLWGSIEGYDSAQEILTMNLDRIKVLESFLDSPRSSGTDGKGDFKEYLNDLLLYQGIE